MFEKSLLDQIEGRQWQCYWGCPPTCKSNSTNWQTIRMCDYANGHSREGAVGHLGGVAHSDRLSLCWVRFTGFRTDSITISIMHKLSSSPSLSPSSCLDSWSTPKGYYVRLGPCPSILCKGHCVCWPQGLGWSQQHQCYDCWWSTRDLRPGAQASPDPHIFLS